jgi:SAM-dependent methyltransferase
MARFLLSDQGAVWLERAGYLPGTPTSHLNDLEFLRQHLPPDKAAAVLEQIQLRARAVTRFERAPQMLFTNAGLQQATHPAVATHRAQRFQGFPTAVDLGCGLGSDTLALSQAVRQIIAIDHDPIRLLFARYNAMVHDLSDNITFVRGDALRPAFVASNLALFCDPGRRTAEGRRIFRPQDYEPPLTSLWERFGHARSFAIKVAPSIRYETVPWANEIEIISLDGQVKEATLWCGELATPGVRYRATLLPSGATVTYVQAADDCVVKPTGRFLYEPDGAVIRAGLVRQVGDALGLWQLDTRIAYLSADTWVSSPFVQGFEIEEQLPFHLKTLRRRLRELHIGILEIKKRGVALDPDAFRRRLKLSGDGSKTLIVTRIGDKPVAYLCRRINTGSPYRFPCLRDRY